MLRLFPYIVVSYWNSTSNHNFQTLETLDVKLYLIEILHQTTTPRLSHRRRLMLYLIEILHQTTTWSAAFEFLLCCILLKFYIKPQLHREYNHELCVVSYWNSTSNHNAFTRASGASGLYLIEILHQTTTIQKLLRKQARLYLIEILHQTTTRQPSTTRSPKLYLIEILHQTTTVSQTWTVSLSCILLKFYIKPQLNEQPPFLPWSCILLKFYIKPQPCFAQSCRTCVVSYWNSTSNHNFAEACRVQLALYLIEILHQTTTRLHLMPLLLSCILLKFYIKPQRTCSPCGAQSVVSYWNSTSNHNFSPKQCTD